MLLYLQAERVPNRPQNPCVGSWLLCITVRFFSRAMVRDLLLQTASGSHAAAQHVGLLLLIIKVQAKECHTFETTSILNCVALYCTSMFWTSLELQGALSRSLYRKVLPSVAKQYCVWFTAHHM